MFRRRAQVTPTVPDQDSQPASGNGSAEAGLRAYAEDSAARGSSYTAAKGRPTPKRSEAQKRRRGPYNAPADRKAASTQARTRDRTARATRYAAAKRGENWALPRKDQGPVRALARDYVDSRRRLSEYYMYAVGLLVVLLFIPGLRAYADYLIIVVLMVMISEGFLVGSRITRLAQQRFPGESIKGVKLYAAIRCTQIRKLRMPAPRVKPGESF
ncbi:MAG TPA: DUF3043 domain-containing protein [Streptosporangiaceae bacterium]